MESDSNSTDTDMGFDPGMRDFASAVAVTFFALNIIFIACAIYKMIIGRRRIMMRSHPIVTCQLSQMSMKSQMSNESSCFHVQPQYSLVMLSYVISCMSHVLCLF